MRPIRDWRAHLGITIRFRGIIPIKPFATGHIRPQIVQIVDRSPTRIGVIRTVTPIRQRHVIVDSDEIDIRMRPQRIKVKEHVARTILRMIAEIF